MPKHIVLFTLCINLTCYVVASFKDKTHPLESALIAKQHAQKALEQTQKNYQLSQKLIRKLRRNATVVTWIQRLIPDTILEQIDETMDAIPLNTSFSLEQGNYVIKISTTNSSDHTPLKNQLLSNTHSLHNQADIIEEEIENDLDYAKRAARKATLKHSWERIKNKFATTSKMVEFSDESLIPMHEISQKTTEGHQSEPIQK